MNVYEALEWALDCLSSDDEVIGEPVPGTSMRYTLNGVTMSRGTTYADSLAEAKAALTPVAGSTIPPLDVPELARRAAEAWLHFDSPYSFTETMEALAARLASPTPDETPVTEGQRAIRELKDFERRKVNPPYPGLVMNDPDAGL